jgi:hypothetical protein
MQFTSRKRTFIIIGLLLGFMLLAVVAFTDHAGATALEGNRGGCGRNNMTTVTCNISDSGIGWVSGACKWGYWFSHVATRRTFRVGQMVTAYGCAGQNQELYAPIRISR